MVKKVLTIISMPIAILGMLAVLIVTRMMAKDVIKVMYNNEWFTGYLTYPFLLLDVAGIIIVLILGISYISHLSSIISANKEKDASAVRNQLSWKRKEIIIGIVYLAILALIAILLVTQITGIVEMIFRYMEDIKQFMD